VGLLLLVLQALPSASVTVADNVPRLFFFLNQPTGTEAINCFKQMKQKALLLLSIFTIAIFYACSKSGSGTSTQTVPVANFTFTPAGNNNFHVPATINFSSSSSNASSLIWNFGDGNSGGGTYTSNKYTNAGTFNVSLNATGTGGSNTKTQSVSILAAYTQVKITKLTISSAGSQTGAFTGYFRFTNSSGTELWKSTNLSFPGTYPVAYNIPTPYVFSNLNATYQLEVWKYNTIVSDVKLANTAFIPALYNLGNNTTDSYPIIVQGINGFTALDLSWQ
jgi:PKD repeat protein